MKRFLVITLALLVCAAFSPALTINSTRISLAWTLSTSTDIVAQKVLYSNTPINSTTGKFNGPVVITIGPVVTAYTIQNLASGTYYMAVTCVNVAQQESGYSNVVSAIVVNPTLPAAPSALQVIP